MRNCVEKMSYSKMRTLDLRKFRTLAQKSGFLIQACWSHLLQGSKELAKAFGAEGKFVHKKLKEIYANAKSLKILIPSECLQLLDNFKSECKPQIILAEYFLKGLFYPFTRAGRGAKKGELSVYNPFNAL